MFKLSEEGVAFVKKEMARYEDKRSAIIPALFRAQSENNGWVSPEAITYLSDLMELPEPWINEVFTFYTMFNKQPVGKYHVQVCCNVSCAMNGGRELADHLSQTFKIKNDEISADGRYTVSRVECLGACDKAPMMQVNDDYHEGLTNEKAVEILRGLK
ncbi:MAG: NADH dehydrogenase [Bdellovibrionales bacterium RBG_16_40_8]|nr:MAG: NADH dehydrogenase [Bdellovibrionales bacterium RBG_16_40_8]